MQTFCWNIRSINNKERELSVPQMRVKVAINNDKLTARFFFLKIFLKLPQKTLSPPEGLAQQVRKAPRSPLATAMTWSQRALFFKESHGLYGWVWMTLRSISMKERKVTFWHLISSELYFGKKTCPYDFYCVWNIFKTLVDRKFEVWKHIKPVTITFFCWFRIVNQKRVLLDQLLYICHPNACFKEYILL